MAVRTHPIFTNFRQGEISPRLHGRVDWERYMSGCVTLENFLIQPQGGVTRRPGTRFVCEVKDSSKATRVIPFRVDDDNIYVLECGDGYVRFIKNHAQVLDGATPYELVAPWTNTNVFEVHYAQAEETLAMVQQSFPVNRLSRYSDTSWRLSAIPFDPPPSKEIGTRTTALIGGTLTPAAVTGTNIQMDASAAVFLASDVGREIRVTVNGSRATITVVDSTTQIHADIEDDFPSTDAVAAGDWIIGGSPGATLTPSAVGPAGASITLTLGANGWRAADVDKYVLVSEGVVKILTYNSGLSATGEVIRELTTLDAQPSYAWSLEEAAWSAAEGYPATIGFFEGRMYLGGPKERFYASASFDYYDFALGSTDDASISYRTTSGDRSAIRWFSPRRQLLMGTASDEFLLTGGNDAAITPTNIRVRPATPHGSGYILPIRSEHATLFIPENGRLLREMAFAYEVDDYRSPNLLDTAEHLTRSYSLVDLAYQRPPESIIWAPRSDGTLLGCTYLREQELIGWHRHVTDGVVESVCTIPAEDGTTEEVWMVVRRTVGGATKRYIEYLDATYDDQWATAPGLVTDCAVTVDTTTATATITGLDHLEGCTVDIVGDGAVFPQAIVSGGTATLAGGTARYKEAGLHFTSTLKTMRPEIPANGTSQGRPKAWPEIRARFLTTIGGTLNGQIITSASPPVLFTGEKVVNKLGWDTDAWITVVQAQPLPMTVLAIYGVLAVGD